MQQLDAPQEKFVGNTTLGILFTNAKLDKARLCKAAGMAHDGYARAIRPVHTSMDGDSIYAVSLGDLAADQDVVGALAPALWPRHPARRAGGRQCLRLPRSQRSQTVTPNHNSTKS